MAGIRELLTRAQRDRSFLLQLRKDPDAALSGFSLSTAERAAILSGSQDLLRWLHDRSRFDDPDPEPEPEPEPDPEPEPPPEPEPGPEPAPEPEPGPEPGPQPGPEPEPTPGPEPEPSPEPTPFDLWPHPTPGPSPEPFPFDPPPPPIPEPPVMPLTNPIPPVSGFNVLLKIWPLGLHDIPGRDSPPVERLAESVRNVPTKERLDRLVELMGGLTRGKFR